VRIPALDEKPAFTSTLPRTAQTGPDEHKSAFQLLPVKRDLQFAPRRGAPAGSGVWPKFRFLRYCSSMTPGLL